MARKEILRETYTFETTGTDDGDEPSEKTLFLSDVSLNQTPDPGDSTTLSVTLGSEEGVSPAYVEIYVEGDEEADFGGISVDAGDTATRSTVITAPHKDEFEVTVAAGTE